MKNKKIFNQLLSLTEQYLRGRSFQPTTSNELIEKLKIKKKDTPVFREVLNTLVKNKVIRKQEKKYLSASMKGQLATGVLRVHPRGFGFLQAQDSEAFPKDIFIPKHLTQNAVDGDKVEVEVNEMSTSEKGPEGKVVTILERSRTHVAGIIADTLTKDSYLAFVPLLGENKQVIVHSDSHLIIGDRVILEVVEWGKEKKETAARLSHKIGHINNPAHDIAAAIEEYDLRKDFPTQVKREAEKLAERVSIKEIRQREDFRSLECVTIDPDTAKDFDDALSLTKDKKGHYHLGVHIADVSHYVDEGSLIEKEAFERANSTYFPGFCLPMLPRKLSENMCSLKPNVVRLAVSVMMEFSEDGTLLKTDFFRSAIKSKKRFTYKEALAVLNEEKKSPFKPLLNLMVELCRLLKVKRYERGSIEFSIPELSVIVNQRGEPVGTDFLPYDITHQMVEEFMLKANEEIAKHLCSQGKQIAFRIHEEPTDENMREFSALVGVFGFKLPEKPSAKELQDFFDEVMDTPYGEYLAVNYIRRMKMALYSPENIGHFGLGLTHYCHFTSPIRRYADLLVHRTLFNSTLTNEKLELLSRHLSEKERISEKAENSVILLKKLRLLLQMEKKERGKKYQAVITRVKPFGIHFEVVELMLEGFLHVSELEDDYFEYQEKKRILRGSRTGKRHATGNQVYVQLKKIDFIYRHADWRLVAPSR